MNSLGECLPTGWADKAELALKAVEVADLKDRSEVINKHSNVWKELKPVLENLSHKKCWYCETRQNRSDMAVDHFRPKRPPKEADTSHPGYWWSAFNWQNFRFCCTYCNSRRTDFDSDGVGGKGEHFPLLNEGARAFSAADETNEIPELLDPTVSSDPLALYFEQTGSVIPRSAEQDQAILYRRAKKSIELYHLNHTALEEARASLYDEIRRMVDLGKTFYSAWSSGNDSARDGYESIIENLRAKLRDDAEHSRSARDALLGLRDNSHLWIEGLL